MKHSLHTSKVFTVTHVCAPPKIPKAREFCEAHGIAPHNGPNYIIYNNNLEECLPGLVERLLRVPVKDEDGKIIFDINGFPTLKLPPKPVKHVWNSHEYFEKEVARLVGLCSPWTDTEFVSTRRKGKCRARYEAARNYFNLNGINRDHSNPHMLVKAEKMLKKSFSTPRIIQASHPVYNLKLGRFVSAAEERIYNAIDLIWDPTGELKVIMKGYNAEEVATHIVNAWRSVSEGHKLHHVINQGDDNVIMIRVLDKGTAKCVGITIDAERFDQHVHADTLHFEHRLYKRLYKNAPKTQRVELATLLSWQAKYDLKGWFRSAKNGKLYRVNVPKVKGRRRSGDMNTSLGNNYLATCLLHGFLRNYQVMELDLLKEQLRGYTLTHGFVCKFENVAECIEEIEFCQAHPINTGHTRVVEDSTGATSAIERWIMVRNLDAITKDTYFICGLRSVEERMSQIGTAGRVMYSDVPVMSALYNVYPDMKVRSYLWQENAWQGQGLAWQSGIGVDGMNVVTTSTDQITDICRLSYEKGFGVSPTEQLNAETDLLGYRKGPFSAPWFAPWHRLHSSRERGCSVRPRTTTLWGC